MSRGFGATYGTGTTDVITTGRVSSGGDLRSISVWLNKNGNGGGNLGRVVVKKASASTQSESLHYNAATNRMAYSRTNSAGTQTARSTMTPPVSPGFPVNGTWFHFLLTHDQTAGTDATPPRGFYDGVLNSATAAGTSQATATPNNTDPYLIGNIPAGTGNWDGLIAHVAIWDGVILDRPEAIALAAGAHPMTIAPAHLVCYLPLDGMHGPETDFILANAPATITGARYGALQSLAAPMYIPLSTFPDFPITGAVGAPPVVTHGPMVSWIY